LLVRATNIAGKRQTMLTAKSDFDYLSLRKTDSKSFATVSKLLVAQKDQSSDDVFSDTLQVFNNKLELKD